MNEVPYLSVGSTAAAPQELRDDGLREIVVGTAVAATFFGLFLGWAGFTPLDSAAQAQGEVTVAGHRQTIQHRDGGIVSAVNVKEGQRVRQGDVLIELTSGEADAQARVLSAQVYSLQAQRARLQAEQLGSAKIIWPATFASLTGEDLHQASQAMLVQEAQFHARASALRAQRSVISQKGVEMREQIDGYRSQILASDEQRRLLSEELDGVNSLAAQGFAPQSRVRALQRSEAEITGQRGQYAASIAQAREQTQETELQILQLYRQHAEEIGAQLRDVQFQLNDAEPKLSAARDHLARQQVRATTTGAVVGLSVFNVGSVVNPSQRLMDIVPDKAGLVVSARVSPSDANSVLVGNEVEIKFPSLHDRNIPILRGRVDEASADSLADEKTGVRYFQIEVSVSPQALQKLKIADNGAFVLKPGLPASVIIPLNKRTALQYLLEPLSNSLWGALREK